MTGTPPPLSGAAGFPGLRYVHCANLTDENLTAEVSFCRNSTLFEEIQEPELMIMENIVSIVVPILFGLIVILGLFGNALVVIVVAANQQMRNTTNLLIINLAIADLLFIIFCVPFTATDYILPFWPFGDVWCKMVQYLIVVTAYASVYTLVLMSLDRFLAVVHPITSMSIRTEKNAITAICVTWIVILVSSSPVFLCHGEVRYTYSSTEHTACVFLDRIVRANGCNKLAFQGYECYEEVFCVDSEGSTRYADIVAFPASGPALILDPTIRYERNEANQGEQIDREKKAIYEKTIPYLKEKFMEKHGERHFEVHGLWFGVRGAIPSFRSRVLDGIGVDLGVLESSRGIDLA